MIYCVSDIHGHYTELMTLLSKIDFCENDTLYILGDLCDRGTENKKVLDFVLNHRDNVKCIMGNHDKFMLDWLNSLNGKCEIGVMDECLSNPVMDLWLYNGGKTTITELLYVSKPYLQKLRKYLRTLPYYKIIANTILVHAGVTGWYDDGNTSEELMKRQSEYDLIWTRPLHGRFPYYNQTKLSVNFIVGHTPTCAIRNGWDKVIGEGNTLFIDCGVYKTGVLACVRLDDGKVFYNKY